MNGLTPQSNGLGAGLGSQDDILKKLLAMLQDAGYQSTLQQMLASLLGGAGVNGNGISSSPGWNLGNNNNGTNGATTGTTGNATTSQQTGTGAGTGSGTQSTGWSVMTPEQSQAAIIPS